MTKKGVWGITILLIVLIAGAVYFFARPTEEPTEEPAGDILTEKEIEELNKPLPEPAGSRAGTFKVSSAKGVYPKFVSGRIDPRRPNIGEIQEISITIRDPQGVTKLTVEIQDKKGSFIEESEFKLIEGDENLGTWAGSWTVHDVADEFRVKFMAENARGEKNDLVYIIWLTTE